MLCGLIKEATLAAHSSGLYVYAPALLHISRVLTIQDHSEANRLFDEAVQLIADLDPQSVRCFTDYALLIGAALRPYGFARLTTRNREGTLCGAANWTILKQEASEFRVGY